MTMFLATSRIVLTETGTVNWKNARNIKILKKTLEYINLNTLKMTCF